MEKGKRKCPRGKLRMACLGGMAALLVSFGTTWAYYSDQVTLVNPLSTSHSGVIMAEEFNPKDSFLPGEAVTKKLWFENTGEMDLFLRVELPPKEEWVDASWLNTEYVIKGWTEAWTANTEEPEDQEELHGERVPAQKQEQWGSTELWSEVFTETDSSGKEHFYRFYRKVLPAAGQTDPILESIKLSSKASNDRHEDDYSGKIYKLEFTAQAVPVENPGEIGSDQTQSLGVQAEWGMEVSLNTESGILTWKQQKQQGGN